MSRGALVVLEGIDRSGKTTQSLKLVENLGKSGIPAVRMQFPNRRTKIGEIIDSYLSKECELDDRAIHLLFSANRWEKSESILALLNLGTTVVVDRYAHSGVAFTAAKGYDLDWCKNPDVGLPSPDVVLFLDVPVETAMERGKFGIERYEKEDFQKKVIEVYMLMKEDNWTSVNADRDPSELSENLFKITRPVVEKVRNRPVEKLWTRNEK